MFHNIFWVLKFTVWNLKLYEGEQINTLQIALFFYIPMP